MYYVSYRNAIEIESIKDGHAISFLTHSVPSIALIVCIALTFLTALKVCQYITAFKFRAVCNYIHLFEKDGVFYIIHVYFIYAVMQISYYYLRRGNVL